MAEGEKSEEVLTRIRLPVVKIVAVLPPLQNGNRVYLLDGSDLPDRGWAVLNFNGCDDEEKRFMKAQNHRAVVMLHKCPRMLPNVRYAWQPREFAPPLIPAACPKCKTRMDYPRYMT